MSDQDPITRLHPAGWPVPAVPLSHGTAGAGLVFVSGQVPTGPDGVIQVGDFPTEVGLALDNVEAVLAESGLGWQDVLKVNGFLSSAQLFAPFNEIYAQRLGDVRPARTTIVTDFGHPDVRVEIDVIARAR